MISFDEIKIQQRPYQELIELLNKKTNINLNYYRRNFVERRIKARMIRIGCDTIECYYNYILSHYDEINKFLNSFTINYSYFFRNWEVFDLFQTLILKSIDLDNNLIMCDLRPDPLKIEKIKSSKKINTLINGQASPRIKRCSKSMHSKHGKEISLKEYQPLNRIHSENTLSYLESTSLYEKITNKNTGKSIKIWSCPCASGEEPYSIAMILDNLKTQIPNFPEYKIIASDIDQDAILKAHRGLYRYEAVKEVSNYFENKYFCKNQDYIGHSYSINEIIKNQVEFVREDITKGHVYPIKYDIIFFRYLLIYFDREEREKFIKIIENHLNVGGLVYLGKTETLFNSESKLKLIDSRDHIYLKN